MTFFLGVSEVLVNTCCSDLSFSPTAAAKSDWTRKSERSCRELQENDVIVCSVHQHHVKENLLPGFSCLCFFLLHFFSLGIMFQAVARKQNKSLHGLYVKTCLPANCLAPFRDTQMNSGCCLSIFISVLGITYIFVHEDLICLPVFFFHSFWADTIKSIKLEQHFYRRLYTHNWGKRSRRWLVWLTFSILFKRKQSVK